MLKMSKIFKISKPDALIIYMITLARPGFLIGCTSYCCDRALAAQPNASSPLQRIAGLTQNYHIGYQEIKVA